jgi:hypothetical protein
LESYKATFGFCYAGEVLGICAQIGAIGGRLVANGQIKLSVATIKFGIHNAAVQQSTI